MSPRPKRGQTATRNAKGAVQPPKKKGKRTTPSAPATPPPASSPRRQANIVIANSSDLNLIANTTSLSPRLSDLSALAAAAAAAADSPATAASPTTSGRLTIVLASESVSG